jgi:glutamate N-acetyltransferase/amino-acid N-acetyltransferase
MAVGKAELPELLPVKGFRLGTASAGIKTPGRLDLVVMEVAAGASLAGVFTRNAFCAAPVLVAKEHLAGHSSDNSTLLLVNTGNANAGTGTQGEDDARHCCAKLAELTQLPPAQVMPFSTGVIGEPLPVDKIIQALPEALSDLGSIGWERAAQGIMTTDTRPKAASRSFQAGEHLITVTGIAKGAGMIKPDMATMLAYIATDAAVDETLLQDMLVGSVNQSFNRITVDGDTSTNDACLLVATGQSGASRIDTRDHPNYQVLHEAVVEVFIELAQGLVRDGEGATKFVTVAVRGGQNEEECLKVAYTIAESPLVKTALFASDPNWGRLLAAIGRAGIDHLDVAKVAVWINDVLIAEQGCRASSYTEEQGVAAMEQENIVLNIDLARGNEKARVWTTDLSQDYVRINAEYRT